MNKISLMIAFGGFLVFASPLLPASSGIDGLGSLSDETNQIDPAFLKLQQL